MAASGSTVPPALAVPSLGGSPLMPAVPPGVNNEPRPRTLNPPHPMSKPTA